MSQTCPYCAEPVEEDAQKCRECGESLVEDKYEPDPNAWGSDNKPQSVLVIGILNILFGVLGVLGMAFSLFVLAVLPKGNNPMLQQMQGSESYQLFQNVSMVVGGFVAIALIFAGYGLVKMKPWGRKLSLYYVYFAVFQVVVGTAANYFLLIQPMMENSRGGPEQAIMGVSTILGGCMGLIFPACIWFFLSRPKVVKAFKNVGET